ncbi:PREDICTED: uncharacterized protein LOC104825137 [Tarenaya hassleriana]|uniref:uncharacterized protein LOC104825137 n=1 Tax=Tarenaya hassleriana TaxID=28532 RepID=UPI00053C9363|nr:PREDICTED: uncharacterized protein LOC104825137 [Tarenaya hassleriana]
MESESFDHMACLFKINDAPSTGWEKSLSKVLSTMKDVNFTIDRWNRTVYVRGKFDPQTILQKIRASCNKHTDIPVQPSYYNPYCPPPPCTRQLHPPEPIYEYHVYDPPARSFPPSLPPPRNFVMGDLQCGIM